MFSMPDVAVILGVVLLVFGPGKLPQIGESLGKGIKSLKKAVEEEEPATEAANKEPARISPPDPS